MARPRYPTARRYPLSVLLTTTIAWTPLPPAAGSAALLPPLNSVKTIGWGFSSPDAIASYQHNLYVGNEFGDTIDVLPLHSGSIDHDAARAVQVWYGSQHHFFDPLALAVYGKTLWVLSGNPEGVSSVLTEKTTLTALNIISGQVARVVTGLGTTSGTKPATLALANGKVFVTDPSRNAITELDANSGKSIDILRATRYGFDDPAALSTMGAYLLVANAAGPYGGSLTQIDASTGAFVRLVSGKKFQFKRPVALVPDGSRLFVVSSGIPTKRTISTGLPAGSITEIELSPPSSSGTSTTSTTTTATTSSLATSSSSSTTGPGTTLSSTTTAVVTSSTIASSTTTTSAGVPTTIPGSGTTTPPNTTTSTTPSPPGTPTASVVRVIAGPAFHLLAPTAATISEGTLLVSSGTGNNGAVVAINADSGAFLKVLSGNSCSFVVPSGLSQVGNAVFVTNLGGGITEIRGGTCATSLQGSPYGFDSPGSIALSGESLFVSNSSINSDGTEQIAELNAGSSRLSRVIRLRGGLLDLGLTTLLSGNGDTYAVGSFGSIYRISQGGQVTKRYSLNIGPSTSAGLAGSTLYVAGPPDDLAALNIVTGHIKYLFSRPSPSVFVSFNVHQPIVFYRADLYYLAISTSGATVVREVNRTTGKLVRVFANPRYHIGAFTSMALWRNDLVLSDPSFNFSFSKNAIALITSHVPYGSLVLINASTGQFVRRIAGKRYDLKLSNDIVSNNDDLFVSDPAADAVTEIEAENGHLVKVMSGSPYDFDDPSGLAIYNNQLYVGNEEADSLTDIKLGSGT